MSGTPTATTAFIRNRLHQLGYSQRGAAEELEINEREFRAYCSGREDAPSYVLYALDGMLAKREKGNS